MYLRRVGLLAGCLALVLSAAGCTSRKAPAVAIAHEEKTGPARAKVADKDAPPFRLPDDEGGALLGKVLPPRERYGLLPDPTGERRRNVKAPTFEPREAALPRSAGTVPRLLVPKAKRVLQPHLVTEEELGGALDVPAVPQRPSFHAGERARFGSDDPAIPPPLPVLARPVSDRAPLDDATLEFSTEAALSAALPKRTAPAPYQRLTMPDPYENRRPLSLPLPPEAEAPVVGAPSPPK